MRRDLWNCIKRGDEKGDETWSYEEVKKVVCQRTLLNAREQRKGLFIWSEWHLSYINIYYTVIPEESPFGKNEGLVVCNINIIAFSNIQTGLWCIEYQIR